jgi:hypothetical protein
MNQANRIRTSRPWLIYCGVGLLTTLVYLAFPTQQYSGDGMRWYAMISGTTPLGLGGTNHLLYPALARLYFSLAHDGLGLPVSFALAQSLNAWFGGAGIAVYAFILFKLTNRWSLTLSGAAALALSVAYSVHAADMTEPIPSIFLSILALACTISYVTNAKQRSWRIIAAGISIGLAATIYQSSVFTLVGVMAILVLCDAAQSWRARAGNVLVCIVVSGIVAFGIYIAAFLLSGQAHTLTESVTQSLITENEQTRGIYAELSLRRMGILFFGLGGAFLGLRGIPSENTFLANGLTADVLWSIGVVGWTLMTVMLMCSPYLLRRLRLAQADRHFVIALLIGLAPMLLMLIFWGARYSKLWIMPLVYLLALLSILVKSSMGQSRFASRLVQWSWIGLVGPVIIFGLVFNLPSEHARPNLSMQDTLDIAVRISPRDLIISDWGGAPYPLPVPVQTVSLVDFAFDANLDPGQIQARLQQAIEDTLQHGGRVFFYGMLDLTAIEWRDFFEQRLKLPYSFLDEYRKQAVAVMVLRLTTPLGNPMHLWRLDL